LRVAVTFVIVSIAWVFFRARDLDTSLHYLGNMFGFLDSSNVAGLVGGLIYQPYFLICFSLAVLITWLAPQTWDLTRRMNGLKVAWCLAMLWLSLAIMVTQSYNPFIYFIF
jgi:alginate O-acetyltransferase complex protein AlgI